MPVAECFLLLTDAGPQGCLLPPVAFRFVVLRYATVSAMYTMISFGPTPCTWLDLSGELNNMKRYVYDFMLVFWGLLKFHDVEANGCNLVLWNVCNEFYSSYLRT